jgi:hypothetical protein
MLVATMGFLSSALLYFFSPIRAASRSPTPTPHATQRSVQVLIARAMPDLPDSASPFCMPWILCSRVAFATHGLLKETRLKVAFSEVIHESALEGGAADSPSFSIATHLLREASNQGDHF